jgi:hypothetical protein
MNISKLFSQYSLLTFISIVIVVLGAGAWILLQKPSLQGQAVPAASSLSQIYSIPLFSVNNPAQQLGTASVQSIGQDRGKIEVTLKFEALAQQTAQPAHIHLGSCAELGKIVYPLNVVENSFSQTILNVSIDQLRSQVPLVLNTHKSEEELNIYIACVDIEGFSV